MCARCEARSRRYDDEVSGTPDDQSFVLAERQQVIKSLRRAVVPSMSRVKREVRVEM